MPVPLLSTDYFSQPAPTGSISGTVARVMAQGGAALSDRIEKQTAIMEARALAPTVTSAYGAAYQKIAAGDMSGFSDLTAASGMGAGNPLLAGLAKDAHSIGADLAQQYTTNTIAQAHIKAAQALATQRETFETGQAHDKFEYERSLHTDTINSNADLTDDKQFEKSQQDVDKENDARSKRNQAAIDAAVLETKANGGTEVKPTLEQLLPQPTRIARSATKYKLPADGGTGPLQPLSGMPNADEPDATPQPYGQMIPAAPASGVPAPVAPTPPPSAAAPVDPGAQPAAPADQAPPTPVDPQAFAKDIMAKYGAPDGKLKVTTGTDTSGNQTREISLTRADGSPITMTKDDQDAITTKLMQVPDAPGATPAPTPAAKLAQATAATVNGKKVDVIDFGTIKFQIGQPDADAKLKLEKIVVKGMGGDKTFATKDIDDGALKALTEFKEGVGIMKYTNPNAAVFVSQFLPPNGRGITFPIAGRTFAKDGKTVESAQMVGISKDGTPVPFNPATRDPANPNVQSTDSVDGTFYNAYHEALGKSDVINSKYGISIVQNPGVKGQAPQTTYAPDLDAKIKQVNAAIDGGDMTSAQGKLEIQRFLSSQDQGKAGSTDSAGYTLRTPDQVKADSISDNSSKIKDIQAQIDKLDATLKSGKVNRGPSTLVLDGAPMATGLSGLTDSQMTGKERDKYIIMRRQLADQLYSLTH